MNASLSIYVLDSNDDQYGEFMVIVGAVGVTDEISYQVSLSCLKFSKAFFQVICRSCPE